MRKYYEKYIFSKIREKEENFDLKIVFLEKNWIYYNLLKINKQKIPEMKISIKILKLTYQMISKSRK